MTRLVTGPSEARIMQDGHPSNRPPNVVDFAAYRTRREPAQATLFDLGPTTSRLPLREQPKPLTARAAAHRARMLEHLRASRG